ncbi:MAG: hypothetical protein C0606_14775 [Hyphomicrobiales bacterium]|nr:MAG: hypothetical protein C0606_14775 [Hyphomicrobiales bacterium]
MIDRKIFFDRVRATPFKGRLGEAQVAGMDAILDEWERRALPDPRWLAYMLATTFHETARTMQPIREYGRGRGRRYGRPDPDTGQTYYGRGFVQLTWKGNYRTMGKLLGIDLVADPERALDLAHATAILFEGMIGGHFTGRKLADYIDGERADLVNARRIINGRDRAPLVAGYAQAFLDAITAATE